jgi:hypothetical protein
MDLNAFSGSFDEKYSRKYLLNKISTRTFINYLEFKKNLWIACDDKLYNLIKSAT